MHVIGIVGGIASGKSTVAAELAVLGAEVLDADQVVRDLLCDTAIKEVLVLQWGSMILNSYGEIDRNQVADLVFGEGKLATANRELLESLLHPRLRDKFEEKIYELGAYETTPAAVIDAPLLLDAGWEDLCDFIVFVESSEQDRVERTGPRNWSPSEISRREAAQMPIDEKRRRATHVIRNLGSRRDLQGEVRAFWDSIFREKDLS